MNLSNIERRIGQIGRHYILNKTKQNIKQFLAIIGQQNILQMVRTNTDFSSVIQPELLAHYREKARQNSWVSKIITREDVLAAIDSDLLIMIKQEENGEEWLNRQLEFLSSLFPKE